MRCLKCGNDNLEPAHLCQVCGAVLPQNPLDIGLIRPGAGSEQPLTSMLYQALIGPVHTDYYLEHFARFDAAGKGGASWNWAAFVNPLGWLAFRRMWTEALLFASLSVLLALALFGALPLLWGSSQELLLGSLALYLATLALLPALWANALYYRHCNRQVTQVLAAAPDIRQTREQLAERSSTWGRGGGAAVVAALAWLVTGVVVAWLVVAAGGMPLSQPTQLRVQPAAVAASAAASAPVAAASVPVLAASMAQAASAPAPARVASAAPAASAALPAASAAAAPTAAVSAVAPLTRTPAPSPAPRPPPRSRP